MTLAEIKDEVDHISESWREGTEQEQGAELAYLDDALAELDDIETNAQAATEAAEELRGRIEILMDEIEISLGMEPAPIEDREGLEIDLSPEEEESLIGLDNPKAKELIGAVEHHLTSGASADSLRQVLEAIDDLDDSASAALKERLDDLRSQVESKLAAEEEEAEKATRESPRLTPAPRIGGRPRSGPPVRRRR